MPTLRAQLPYLATNQSQKETTYNEAMNIIDIVLNGEVINMTTSTPPGSPSDGDAYIVGSSATDDWDGEDGNFAFYLSGWNFVEAYEGQKIYNKDDSKSYRYNGTTFVALGASIPATPSNDTATSPNNATTGDEILEELVTVTGATTDTTILIPNRSIVEAVSIRVVSTVTGATSFDCGVAGNTSQFGGTLGVASGSTNIGVIGPTAFYSDTAVRLTANGSNFTGGTVRVAIHCRRFQEPQT